jgi:PP-loop superfamily ATP-utilizing enzyme
MKMYLSYGGGVNSTAMLLLLHDKGWEFESIYVDHGCDWPETREYVKMMAQRLPITMLRPDVQGHSDLYEYCEAYRMIPSRVHRWCTSKFKVRTIEKYVDRPCFQLVGFSTDEAHRAKLQTGKGIEARFPLLEYEISRDGCLEIIKDHGLPIPIKSGCYFCPFQRVSQWRLLRRKHPELFCKAKRIEDLQNQARADSGKSSFYLYGNSAPLDVITDEKQSVMWGEMKPPCSCGL